MKALLAQFPMPPISDVAMWVWGFIGVMIAGIVVLTFAEKWHGRFGRKPALDDTLASLRKELAGLAPSAKVDKLIEQIASAATKQEVADAIEGVRSLIEREVGSHKAEIHNQLTETRSYLHEQMHGLRDQLNVITVNGRLREANLENLIRELDRVNEARSEKLHARINEVIDRMPDKIVGLLSTTKELYRA